MVRREDEKIIERKDMEEGQKRDKKNMMSRRKKGEINNKKIKINRAVCQLEKQKEEQCLAKNPRNNNM